MFSSGFFWHTSSFSRDDLEGCCITGPLPTSPLFFFLFSPTNTVTSNVQKKIFLSRASKIQSNAPAYFIYPTFCVFCDDNEPYFGGSVLAFSFSPCGQYSRGFFPLFFYSSFVYFGLSSLGGLMLFLIFPRAKLTLGFGGLGGQYAFAYFFRFRNKRTRLEKASFSCKFLLLLCSFFLLVRKQSQKV